MRHKDIITINEYPYLERGMPNEQGQTRKIRCLMAPELTGDPFAVVHVAVPMGTTSPGHIHPDFDEIIFFPKAGRVRIEDTVYDVPANGVYIARRGIWHEILASETEDTENYCVYTPFSDKFQLPEALIIITKEYLAGRTD